MTVHTKEIEYQEVEYNVEYEHHEGEAMVWNDGSGGGYPGSAAEIVLTAVYREEEDIIETMSGEDLEWLKEEIREKH